MKIKKQITMLCVVVVVCIMASTITGCQTNTAEEISKEETSEENTTQTDNGGTIIINNQLETVPMDASLNLNLDKYEVLGKSLSEWTYEDLCDHIYANCKENPNLARTDPYTGAYTRYFYNESPQIGIYITEGYYIRISTFTDTYFMTKLDWCRSMWNITPNSSTLSCVASIYGQPIGTCLESICPGLYEKLLEGTAVTLKDGLAMMNRYDNGMESISLCIPGANFDLGYTDGVIDRITLYFME